MYFDFFVFPLNVLYYLLFTVFTHAYKTFSFFSFRLPFYVSKIFSNFVTKTQNLERTECLQALHSNTHTIEEIADRFGKLDFQSQKPFFEGQTRKRSIFIHVSDSLLVSKRIFKYIYFFFKLQRLIVGHYDDNVRFRRPSLERSFLFVF